MRRVLQRTILWCALGLMLVLIFSMSAQSGDDSTGISDRIVLPILDVIGWIRPDLDASALEELYWPVQTIVRKTAHMAEFALLAVLILLLLISYERKHAGIWAWVLSLVNAVLDELHQTMVDGRMAMATDVLIDGVGALLGILVTGMILKKWKKIET